MPLPVVRLDEAARDYYLKHGGIKGSELEGRTTTTPAYERNLALLHAHLRNIDEPRFDAADPYFIKPSSDPDPLLWVEIRKPEILTPRLIREVHAAVCAMDDDYRAEVCDALGHLENRFNVFVERGVIYVYAEEESIVESLGLLGGVVEPEG